MPTIDPELVVSLSKISDILIKRPGKVNIEGIKRLSNIYGFETFTDTLTLDDNNTIQYNSSFTDTSSAHNNSTNNNSKQLITRLTLSGKILLIDIDFLSDNTTVKNVSLSSAINIIPLSENKEVMNGKEVEMVLFKNLQYKTLDKFNKNLRIISQLDRLSLNSPNDLFNFFNQLSYNLKNIHTHQIGECTNGSKSTLIPKTSLDKSQVINDFEQGNLGIGKLQININEKIGLFLKIWEDNRFVNQSIYETYNIKTKEMENPYLIHFKIRERNDFKNEYEFNELENSIRNHNSNSNSNNNNNTNNNGTSNSEGDNNETNDKSIEEFKRLWYTNGKWDLNTKENNLLNSNLKLLIFEFLPCIWIPEDIISELGITTYEENNDIVMNHYEEPNKIEQLDVFYRFFNSNNFNSCLNLGGSYQVNLLIGCKLIKLYKFKIDDIPNQLELIINRIRSWLLVNRLILNLVKGFGNLKEDLENCNKENADYEADVNLMDLIKDSESINNLPLSDLKRISISFRDFNSSDFYITLKINDHKFLIQNGQISCSKNSKLAEILAVSEDINRVLHS